MKRAAILVLAVAISACSEGDGDASSADEEGLAAAVQAYTAAFGAGDTATAWSLVSQRCQTTLGETTFQAGVFDASSRFSELAASDVSVTVDGDRGIASYSVEGLGDYTDQAWQHELGAWRWDAC